MLRFIPSPRYLERKIAKFRLVIFLPMSTALDPLPRFNISLERFNHRTARWNPNRAPLGRQERLFDDCFLNDDLFFFIAQLNAKAKRNLIHGTVGSPTWA